MAQAVQAFNDFLSTDEGQQMIRDLGSAIGDLAMSFLDPGPDGFKNAVNTAKTLLKGVTDALRWLKNNKEGVKTALGVIAGGFAVFETAKGVLNLIEAGKSVKNIFSAKNKSNTGNGGTPGISTGDGGTPGGSGLGGAQSVGSQTVTSQTVTSETVTTSNVSTMYVGQMIGGNNGTPSNPTNPATPPVTNPSNPSGGGLPSGSSFPGLPSGGGLPFNGATPLLNAGGGDGLNLSGGNPTVNLPSGNPTVNISGGNPTLNLPSGSGTPSGGGSPIRLDPNEFDVTEAGKPQLRWPEDSPPQPEKPTDNGGGGFGWAAAAFAIWGTVLYGATTGLDHLLGDAQRAKDIEARESALEKAEEAAAALGPEFQDDVDTLTRMVNALGPAVDKETGEYKKNPFFSTYWEPTNDLGAILGDLGDLRKRGLLHADIEKWGARDGMGDLNVPGTGWTPWNLLRRYWGVYTETAYDRNGNPYEAHVDMPLDPQEVNALLAYLQDMYTRKLEDAMKSGSVPAEAGAEVGEEFTQGVEGTAGEDAGKGAGSAFITGGIQGMDANSSALAAAADRMGRVMRQGVVSGASGIFSGLGGGVYSAGGGGGVLGAGGLNATIYMDKTAVGTMVADTVNRVMGAHISASRR